MNAMYAEHAGPLMRFLLGLTGGERYAAEDLLQETMLRAWRRLDSLPPTRGEVRRWLYTVARRLTIDAARRRRVRPQEIQLVDLRGVPTADETLGAVLAAVTMRRALAGLSTSQRALLVELYVHGKTIKQTAEMLGVPDGTIKSRAHYAVRALREAAADTGERSFVS
ncbi:sigma-70 family RNA polymerase sigma factor [Actinoplanes sp. TBRC 11911]|nr:sigma-70 family RNA polymerase sigma factor [Actinoplanes sp. TBRC 11911]